jgi:hypothetical protein
MAAAGGAASGERSPIAGSVANEAAARHAAMPRRRMFARGWVRLAGTRGGAARGDETRIEPECIEGARGARRTGSRIACRTTLPPLD